MFSRLADLVDNARASLQRLEAPLRFSVRAPISPVCISCRVLFAPADGLTWEDSSVRKSVVVLSFRTPGTRSQHIVRFGGETLPPSLPLLSLLFEVVAGASPASTAACVGDVLMLKRERSCKQHLDSTVQYNTPIHVLFNLIHVCLVEGDRVHEL